LPDFGRAGKLRVVPEWTRREFGGRYADPGPSSRSALDTTLPITNTTLLVDALIAANTMS
jgi:hypothetical protein